MLWLTLSCTLLKDVAFARGILDAGEFTRAAHHALLYYSPFMAGFRQYCFVYINVARKYGRFTKNSPAPIKPGFPLYRAFRYSNHRRPVLIVAFNQHGIDLHVKRYWYQVWGASSPT